MQTFRRLNDPEKYYGLSWRGWVAAAAGGGVLYLAIRLSPFGVKPTISFTVIVLSLAASILHALSGQALGPGRFAAAAVRHRIRPAVLAAPEKPAGRVVVLAGPPPATDADSAPVEDLEEVFA